jgi:hypothetical protein
MNIALIDDTVLAGALREALKDRGFELDGIPPADFRQRNLSVLASAMNPRLKKVGFSACTTRSLIESAAPTIRARAVGHRKVLLERIVEKLIEEVAPIIFEETTSANLQNRTDTVALEAAISLFRPVLVITSRERLPHVPHLLLDPIAISPEKWLVEASGLC